MRSAKFSFVKVEPDKCCQDWGSDASRSKKFRIPVWFGLADWPERRVLGNFGKINNLPFYLLPKYRKAARNQAQTIPKRQATTLIIWSIRSFFNFSGFLWKADPSEKRSFQRMDRWIRKGQKYVKEINFSWEEVQQPQGYWKLHVWDKVLYNLNSNQWRKWRKNSQGIKECGKCVWISSEAHGRASYQ